MRGRCFSQSTEAWSRTSSASSIRAKLHLETNHTTEQDLSDKDTADTDNPKDEIHCCRDKAHDGKSKTSLYKACTYFTVVGLEARSKKKNFSSDVFVPVLSFNFHTFAYSPSI